jgi:hypothetical protein
MKLLRNPFIIGTVAAMMAASCDAAIIANTFGTEAGYTANFTTPTGRPALIWSSDAGVGEVAGRLNAGTDPSSFYAAATTASFGTFSTGSSYTVSVFGLTVASIGQSSNISIFGVGIGTAASTTVTTGQVGWRMDIRQVGNSSTEGPLVAMRLRNELGSSSPSVDSGDFTIQSSTWYEMRMVATALGSNEFSVTTSVLDWGSDGLTGGSVVQSVTETFTNANVGSSGLHAGFFVRTQNGFVAADNLTVVPEPRAYGAFLGLIACGLVVLRRRSGVVQPS